MTQPKVVITELDGALGILPPDGAGMLAVVGVSSKGPTATPAAYGRVSALVADFGEGPLVEAAAYYIQKTGNPALVCRTGQATAASEGAVVHTGTGASVASVHTGTHADDDLEVVILITLGGVVGVGPISFKYSLDGGRTYSAEQSLGTAAFYVIPGTGGLRVDFTAAATVTGDTYAFPTIAPMWDSTNIGAAIAALGACTQPWELALIVGRLDGTLFDAVETAFAALTSAGKYHAWIGGFRVPDVGESESAYKTAFDAAFGAKSTVIGDVCAGGCKIVSAVSGRQYRRPISFPVAAREAALSQEQNSAAVNLGALIGVSIRDVNGNPDEHDESINPGLDDSRATVLRTWDGIPGVYINRPRILSAAGSDFDILPKRRVMNLIHSALRLFFIRRLELPIQVNPKTGFILEAEALEIESGARAAMRAAVSAKPKASGVEFTLSRTDNILSTKTLTGSARAVPLGYPETVNLDVGFKNPALQVVSG